jgi:outer membrane protein
MKNINLIINIVLAVALGALFVLYFSLRSQVNKMNPQPLALPAGSAHLVYVNLDTLYEKYDMYTDMKAQFEEKKKKMEDELALKKSNYERNVMDYQDKMKKGLMLRSEAEKVEQKLYSDQQSLMSLSNEMQSQLATESQIENRKLVYTITDFLKEYNKSGYYQYIFSYQFGGSLLYANDSLNITNAVIKALNEKYSKDISRRK